MKKMKIFAFSILFLVVLMIPTNLVLAEDYKEVNVSGVTVYVIMKLDSNYSQYNEGYENYFPPSCYFILNDTSRDELVNFLTSKGLNILSRSMCVLCSTGSIEINYGEIILNYDGGFLMGRKEVITDNESVTIEEAKNKIKNATDDIVKNMAQVYNLITDRNWTVEYINRNELFMKVIFVKNTTPSDITNGTFKTEGEYEIIDSDYTKEFDKLLDRLGVSETKVVGKKSKDKQVYEYYAVKGIVRYESIYYSFNKPVNILIVGNEYPQYNYPLILMDTGIGGNGIFNLWDFWRIFYRYRINASALLTKSTELYKTVYKSKENFLENISVRNTSYCLNDLTPSNDEKSSELKVDIGPLENYYNAWKAELESAKDKPDKPNYALFGDEVSKEIDEFYSEIEGIKENLRKADETNKELRELCYVESQLELMKKGIEVAHNDTTSAINTAHDDAILILGISVIAIVATICVALYTSYKNEKSIESLTKGLINETSKSRSSNEKSIESLGDRIIQEMKK